MRGQEAGQRGGGGAGEGGRHQARGVAREPGVAGVTRGEAAEAAHSHKLSGLGCPD